MRLVKNKLLERAKSEGVELHARSVYLQGLLLCDRSKRPQGAERYVKILGQLAKEQFMSVKELCFLYVRDCAFIDRFFVGCETVVQVKENLALYNYPPLPKELTDRLPQLFADVPDYMLNPSLFA